jgi:hypothetical protein
VKNKKSPEKEKPENISRNSEISTQGKPGDSLLPDAGRAMTTSPSHRHWDRYFSLLFVLAGRYLSLHGYEITGTLIILFTVTHHYWSILLDKASVQGIDFFTGWMLTAPLFFLSANAEWVLPDSARFSPLHAILMAAGGYLILWTGFRSLPRELDAPDLSSFQARAILLLLLVFAVIYRMQNATLPVGNYGYDQCEETHDAWNIIDLSSHHFIFPYGARGPLITYLAVGIWKLFPEASSLLMMRITLVLVDVLSLWVFYLLGKEFDGKRRTGLFFAALGAVSRQMLLKIYLGTYASCLILFVAFALLMLFRLFKKPDFRHFLYWAFAVCIGNYAYLVFRPWTLALILIVLIWIMARKSERAAGLSAWILGLGVGGWWIYYFLYYSGFIEKFLGVKYEIPSFWCAVFFVLLLQAFFEVYWASRREGRGRKLLYWAFACCLAYFFVEPIFKNPAIYYRLQSIDIAGGGGFFSPVWLKTRFEELYSVLYFLFLGGGDLIDIGPTDVIFFEFYAIFAIALGLIVFFAHPSWKILFLFIPFFIGISPRFGNSVMHSARLLACIVPLYLIAAVGLNRLWEASRSTAGGKLFTRFLLLPVLVLGLVLAAKTNSARANHWYFNYQDPEVIFYHQITRESADSRIYAGFSSYQFPAVREVSEILNVKRDIYMWNKSNPIYLAPDEKCRDVVFFAGGSELETMAKEAFPKAQWSLVNNVAQAGVMQRILIPGGQITEDPGRKLNIVRVPDTYWRRRLYDGYYGLAKGIILSEDWVPNPAVPFPSGISGLSGYPPTGSLKGPLDIRSPGKYRFSCKTTNLVVLLIDGEKMLDIRPGDEVASGKNSIFLSSGTHTVEIKIHFKYGMEIPQVFIKPPSGQKHNILEPPSP